MNLKTSIKRAYRNKGIRGVVQAIFRKLAGTEEYEEQIATLHFFINAYLDISKAPKATGVLRDLQECDTVLLAIFDKICRKHNLTYWLDFGTLLGAIRHGGFIPWDDDVDVLMPRDAFDRAKTILSEELSPYGIVAKEDILMGRIGIGYQHKQTGIWMDVFPVDYCSADLLDHANRAELSKQIRHYRKKLSRSDEKRNLMRKKEIITSLSTKENAVSMFLAAECTSALMGWNLENIFPLREISFEGYSLYVPANENHLTELYGPNYMQFPRTGVLHHGDETGGLVDWIKNSGMNMIEIKREFETILNSIEV